MSNKDSINRGPKGTQQRCVPHHKLCQGCPNRGARVYNRGNQNSTAVIVGEGPGTHEIQQKIPFVGNSGHVLWSTLGKRAEELDPFVTNATLCQLRSAKAGDDGPKLTAAGCCRERLHEDILDCDNGRLIILALGGISVVGLTGNKGFKITQERGQIINSHLARIGILPTYHPAFLLRGGGSYRQFRQDIDYFYHLATGGKPKLWQIPTTYSAGEGDAGLELIKAPPAALGYILKQPRLALDIETSGFNRFDDDILSCGISWSKSEGAIIPGENVEDLRTFFRNYKGTMIWHNGKFDVGFLRAKDIPARVDEDTMLLSYCLDETGGVHDLEQVSFDWLGAPDYKYILKKWAPKKTDSYANVPRDVLYPYNVDDTGRTYGNFDILREKVRQDPKLEKLYTEIMIPGSEMLSRVEQRGMMVDVEYVRGLSEELAKEVKDKREEMQEMVGWEVNPNSPQQLKFAIYKQLRIPPYKGRRNTAKETLDKLPNHPFIKLLKEYRKLAKMYGTYVGDEALGKGMFKNLYADGRVHPTYLLHGTVTGRLASRNPNLQNIPRDPKFRGMFVASPGYVLLEMDLNQAELRSLAIMSGDEFLCEVFADAEKSLHDEVALAMYGPGYTKDQRIRAKAVNFGIVYGREASSLAEEFGISLKEGQRMIDAWFERAPEAAKFIKRCRQAVANGETITTPFGRKRRFPIVSREQLKSFQNEAANFPHQATASDINLKAAIQAQDAIEARGAYIVNLVHDSVIVECPEDEETIQEVSSTVRSNLVSVAREALGDRIEFLSDCKRGVRWGHLKEI